MILQSRDRMYVYVLVVTFIIDEAYSLKDKRKVVKSIIERAQARFKVSAAEIAYHDIHNQSQVAFAIVTNNSLIARKHLDELFRLIENYYPITVTDYETIEY